MKSLAIIEAELLRRGLDPDFIVCKTDIPGDVAEIVSRTEFLALQLRYGYQRAIATVRARIELAALERELRATTQSAAAMRTALEAARVNDLGQVLDSTVRNTLEQGYLRGAREGERTLRTQAQVRIRFDAMNPHAAQYARTQSGQLITQITEGQREAVRNLIETSVSNGRTVQDIARDIRTVVGLRDDQVRALLNYRERITLRGTHTEEQIERKVARYADALARQRGELIARTEVLTAANHGQLETWREAKRQGVLGREYRKQWVTTPDELLCPECEALDGVTADLHEEFVSADGTRAMAPTLHPNCRCSMVLTKDAG
jgi:SPP1 gp7 family putative phage head morphogenesis protein